MFVHKAKKLIAVGKKSAWTFPLLAAIVLLGLTAFRISGTSVGVYHQALYGADSHDPNLLYGKPRAIRSDEWLTSTQSTVSQSKLGFPRVNTDMAEGQDLSLMTDMPVKDWSAVFKPQLWSFFILPVEYAFAFKWWLLMYLLVVSCYFFVLRMLPGQKLVAAIFSLAIGISPFELWWYQSGAFLTLAYGFFSSILIMRMVNGEALPHIKSRRLTTSVYGLVLAFLLTCFGLIIYPPFQVPIAVAVGFFAAGYILNKKFAGELAWSEIGKKLATLLAPVLIAGVIIGLFLYSHRSTVHAINSSLYPGARTISSGGLKLLKVFDSFMMPQLQSDAHGAHFLANQSEDSNFILIMPFLLIPGFVLIGYEYLKRRAVDWLLLALQLCSLMFLARMFVPVGNHFYKLMLLQKVPNERLIIGLGFVGIMQSIYLLKKLGELKLRQWTLLKLSAAYSLGCFVVLWFIGLYTRAHYPLFISRRLEILLFAALFSGIIFLWLANRRLLAVLLFLIFSVGSSFRIMPLYRGLGFDSSSLLTTRMAQISNPGDSWGTVDLPLMQNAGLLAGRNSLTGSQFYPNLNFWHQAFGDQYDQVFNRQAHVILSTDPSLNQPAKLVIGDFYELKFECSSFIEKHVNYALSNHPLSYSCAKLVDTVAYPQQTFYLYKISQ